MICQVLTADGDEANLKAVIGQYRAVLKCSRRDFVWSFPQSFQVRVQFHWSRWLLLINRMACLMSHLVLYAGRTPCIIMFTITFDGVEHTHVLKIGCGCSPKLNFVIYHWRWNGRLTLILHMCVHGLMAVTLFSDHGVIKSVWQDTILPGDLVNSSIIFAYYVSILLLYYLSITHNVHIRPCSQGIVSFLILPDK